MLCFSPALWNVIFPVFHGLCLFAFSFQNFFILRVFICSLSLKLFVLSLSAHGILVLFLSQLLNWFSGQVVTWLKHLVFVLLSEVDSLIDSVFLNNNPLHRALVSIYHRSTVICFVGGTHQIRNFVKTIFLNGWENLKTYGNVLDLQRRQTTWFGRPRFSFIFSLLFLC